LWPRNPAKCYRSLRYIFGDNAAPNPPDNLVINWKILRGRATGKHHGICPLQCRKRFAQATRRQQVVAAVFRRNQNYIEIAVKSAMLKAVIEHVKLCAELRLRVPSRLVAVLSH